jgi:hypothetical protein
MNENLSYALAYATKLGFRVFPLRGKVPRTEHGSKEATTDTVQLRRWWMRWPTAGIGIACGSGLMVVDVDPRNGGDDTFDALVDFHGPLPETVHCLTGGGGHHYYFAVPDGARFPKKRGVGIELQGEGAYVVAPPSTHPNGRRYAWEDSARPGEVAIAQAPEWLREGTLNSAAASHEPATGPAAETFLARCFYVLTWLGKDLPNGCVSVRCPWSAEHSDGRGQGEDSSAVIRPPTAKAKLGRFYCSHGHCAGRGTIEALRALPTQALVLAGREDPDGLQAAKRLLMWAPGKVA